MLYIKNVLTLEHEMTDYSIPSPFEEVIDATGLTLFPPLIDPHVTIDQSLLYTKEAWKSLTRSALSSGTSSLFLHSFSGEENPNKIKERIREIETFIKQAKVPLRVKYLIDPHWNHLDLLPLIKSYITGVWLSLEKLLLKDQRELKPKLERLFRLCAEHNIPLKIFLGYQKRNGALLTLLQRCLHFAEHFYTKVYLYPILNHKDLYLVKAAKEHRLPIYTGTDIPFLFLYDRFIDTKDPHIQLLQNSCTKEDCTSLWEGIHNQWIDCLGSGHHLQKKGRFLYSKSIHNMELSYPLILTATAQKRLSLNQALSLLSKNAEAIFELPPHHDYTLIDTSKASSPRDVYFRCPIETEAYSYAKLLGWPVYTLTHERSFKLYRNASKGQKK